MAGTGRPGDRTFFIYDHSVVQREEDDPKDAIIYFYPHSIDVDTKCLFCGQLMGMVNLMKTLGDSMPRLYRLKKLKIATMHEGNFTLALAGKIKTPDDAVIEKLHHVYSVFAFYHGSLQKVLMESKNEREAFLKTMDAIWDCYLPFIRRYGNMVPAMFEPIPRVQLHKSASLLYLRCSHILQWLRSKTQLLGGCILYKNSVLCTQLTPELTSHLLLIRPNQSHLPSKMVSVEYNLPFGVRIMSVYLTKDEYRLFAKQTKTSQNYAPNKIIQEPNQRDASVNSNNKMGCRGNPQNTTNSPLSAVQLKSRDSSKLNTVLEHRTEDINMKDIHISQPQDRISNKEIHSSGSNGQASTEDIHVSGSNDIASNDQSSAANGDDLICSTHILVDEDTSDGEGITTNHSNEDLEYHGDDTAHDQCVINAQSHATQKHKTFNCGDSVADNTMPELPNTKVNHDGAESRTKDVMSVEDDEIIDSLTLNGGDEISNTILMPCQLDAEEIHAGTMHDGNSVELYDGNSDELHDGNSEAVHDGTMTNLITKNHVSEQSTALKSSTLPEESQEDCTTMQDSKSIDSAATIIDDSSNDGYFVNNLSSNSNDGDSSHFVNNADCGPPMGVTEEVDPGRDCLENGNIDTTNASENQTENSCHSNLRVNETAEPHSEIQPEDVESSNVALLGDDDVVTVPCIGHLDLPDVAMLSNSITVAKMQTSIGDLETQCLQARTFSSDDEANNLPQSFVKTEDDDELSETSTMKDGEMTEEIHIGNTSQDIDEEHNEASLHIEVGESTPVGHISENSETEKEDSSTLENSDIEKDLTTLSVHTEMDQANVSQHTETEQDIDNASVPTETEKDISSLSELTEADRDIANMVERTEADIATVLEDVDAEVNVASISQASEAEEGITHVPEDTDTVDNMETLNNHIDIETDNTIGHKEAEAMVSATEEQNTDVDEVDGMVNVSLYVQAHSDMVLLYLADKSFIEDKVALLQVWRSVLTELGELEPKLKQCAQHRAVPDKDSIYNFIQYDNFDRLMQSSLDNPVTPTQNEFCRAAHMLHQEFTKDDSVTDITVRNHRGAVYAHQNVSHQTYVQSKRTPSTTTGIPSRDDLTFFLDVSAQKLLYRDHSINIL